ncbi:MAG: CoA transferase subunit A [Desulfarculus sp.]|nr:CoA transferase subunit A [Desulfarculus sp.]
MPMTNKLITLAQAVARYTWDGMTYAHGAAFPVGADSVVFGREMARQGRRGLNLISHCGSQQLNLLAALGAVRRVEVGFSGLEVYGFAKGLNRAVVSGQTIIEDYSNGAMALRFLGGALNWPFVPATVCLNNDQQWCSGDHPDEYPCARKIPEITDPFSGKKLGAFSVLRPQVAAIHVTMADMEGNAIMLGSEWSRFEMARAAGQVVLVAERIVDQGCMRQYPNLVRIISEVVEAIVYWPWAAWPQSVVGLYDSDEEHMLLMNDMLATAEGTAQYLERYVRAFQTRAEFQALIGPEKMDRLAATATAFLMDPYRRWILPDDQIAALEQEG